MSRVRTCQGCNLTFNAPVTLTEPAAAAAAAAEAPAAETQEPQPEVVAESGKAAVQPELEPGPWQTQA